MGSQFVIIAGNHTIAITLFYIGVITWFILIYTVFTVFAVKDKTPYKQSHQRGVVINYCINSVDFSAWEPLVVTFPSLRISCCFHIGYVPCGCMFYIIIITLIVYRMSFLKCVQRSLHLPTGLIWVRLYPH